MRRIIIIVLALALSELAVAAIADAQPTQAQFDSLKAEVAKLRREIGPYGDSVPPTASFPSKCITLPNGRYSVWCRVQQIGIGIDENNARVAALEARPTSGTVVGNVVEGNLMVHGKLCVFAESGIPVDAALCGAGYQVSVIGQGANFGVVSNWYGTDAQYAGEKHCASFGLDPDGGIRIRNNSDFGWCNQFHNADRAQGYAGYDSQSDWSWYQQPIGSAPLGTQSLVLRTDLANQQMYFASWRPNWTIGFRTSGDGCKWCENISWNLTRTMTAAASRRRAKHEPPINAEILRERIINHK